MNAAGIPTPSNAGVRPVFPSICSQKKPIEFFWFQTDVAADLEEAFEEYVAPQFESDYAAAMAEEEFLDTIDRAKKGVLKPVYEVKEINAKTTSPERIFEIRNGWPNTKRGSGTWSFSDGEEGNANRYDAVANANSGCDLCETTFAGMSCE
ncbi:hypothetical protein [Bifidobacterium catenulatum]|uniref:Uncharacterized protein n=1 Tax=Bifidobacterium catenulatum PV20-2 TaxID=1447716 RepID=A0A0A7I5J1_9BIFI|nr:hypothetical protein [Bifidobacterium catenulatum]AIZ15498.1 hypothetical protein AH68_08555 [Bifidobacterium catenulatum PV20-2]